MGGSPPTCSDNPRGVLCTEHRGMPVRHSLLPAASHLLGGLEKTHHLPQPSLSVAEGEVGVIKEGPLEERVEAE